MSSEHGTSGGHVPKVSGYEMLRLLGQGGMGKVYLAQQALKRLVCVKVLSIPEGEDADLCRAMFAREAELLASVSHPHILSVFDFGTTADLNLPFLVTEYIEEGDLRKRMSKGHAMPIDRVRSILSQVGKAWEILHGKEIIHRDLKPENILMPTDAECKVGDFGLAVMQDKAGLLTRSIRGLGTPGYVSPEQQYGLKIDERTDQYSLAALGYELLTGRPTGKVGEALKERNWAEAEKQVNAEVEARAFQFWEQQGRPVGPEGEAASKKNRHIAEIQLLQETEDEFRRKPIH